MTEPDATPRRIIGPQQGPQEAFLACQADIAVYGGAAYGGKTVAVLLWMLGIALAGKTSCIVFRRESPRLTGGGSIWEESHNFYRAFEAVPRQSPSHEWRFPNGSTIEFAHLQHEWDAHNHQGKRYQCVVFEEATEFEESQFWFLWGRTASKDGIRRHARLTCNPDPDSFVRKLIDWWIGDDGFPIAERSGVLRWFVRDVRGELHWFDTREAASAAFPGDRSTSLTFIPAKTSDNKLGDPHYAETLKAMPLVMRARMLGGNWNIRHQAGSVFRREWFRIVDDPPSPIIRAVRGWDKGASAGGDWTRGAKWCELSHGYCLADMTSLRGTPAEVISRMRSTAELDGLTTRIAIWQDPGQAGIVDAEWTRSQLPGYAVDVHRAASSKVEYAEQWSAIAERGARGEGPPVYIKRAPWNAELLAELEGFPDGPHDDQVDAISCAHQSLRTSNASTYRPAVQRARGGFH